MSQPYTFGVWIVKPGREEDFVAGWRELAAVSYTHLTLPTIYSV